MGLKVENVSKTYGIKKAVDHISFEINSPGVFGLLGTNGAGKTTTIRMMLGIIKKDSGEITWKGKEVARKYVNFGYLPEERGIYPKSKIQDQLLYFAKLKGMSQQEAQKAIQYWAKRLEIEEYMSQNAEKLSKGNQQKVQFMTAVMHEPELIILDEPFSGLDPVNTQLLRDIIMELVDKKTYIVMSSHQMTSIEEFCKEVVIINRGKTVLKGNLQEIKNSYPSNGLELIVDRDCTSMIQQVGLEIKFAKNHEYNIVLQGEEKAYQLFQLLAQQGVKVNKFEIRKPTLQEIFIEKVGEEK